MRQHRPHQPNSDRDIEEASSIAIDICPGCGTPVISFCDRSDQPFASASISPSVAERLIAILQEQLDQLDAVQLH